MSAEPSHQLPVLIFFLFKVCAFDIFNIYALVGVNTHAWMCPQRPEEDVRSAGAGEQSHEDAGKISEHSQPLRHPSNPDLDFF